MLLFASIGVLTGVFALTLAALFLNRVVGFSTPSTILSTCAVMFALAVGGLMLLSYRHIRRLDHSGLSDSLTLLPNRQALHADSTRCRRPDKSDRHRRAVASSSALGRMRRPTATTVSPARTNAASQAAASAFSRAMRWAYWRGISPVCGVSSISDAATSSGVIPSLPSSSRRRGLPDARTSRSALTRLIAVRGRRVPA